jgi:hypothetical protein
MEVPNKGVRFTTNAQVWLIPRREDYSLRLRKLLWYERHEHLNNIRRNTMEFWYEGWNWRTVMEEASMYTNIASGEHIHPVHVQEYYYQLQQQQQEQQQAAARQAQATAARAMSPSGRVRIRNDTPYSVPNVVATPSTLVDTK